MVNIRVYVEGGGSRKDLKAKCRRAFRTVFERATGDKVNISVAVSGDRGRAHNDYRRAHNDYRRALDSPHEVPLLLVDSEAPVRASETPWAFLKRSDHWSRPAGAHDLHAHLMV